MDREISMGSMEQRIEDVDVVSNFPAAIRLIIFTFFSGTNETVTSM